MKGGLFIAAKKPMVKCKYCGKSFYREDCEWVKIKNRYAHAACATGEASTQDQEEEEMYAYMKQLFQTDTLATRIYQQVRQYLGEGKTYKGIYKTLKYWYEIKNGSIEQARGGIGIVEYIYDDAQAYWVAVQMAREHNQQAQQTDAPQVREVHIINPLRKPMRHLRPQFTFLDEEAQDSGKE